jgi:hypothetical protein
MRSENEEANCKHTLASCRTKLSGAPNRECGGGEGFEFDSSCSPALSDEGEMREIIQRALHWTRGSEWLRPVSIPV